LIEKEGKLLSLRYKKEEAERVNVPFFYIKVVLGGQNG